MTYEFRFEDSADHAHARRKELALPSDTARWLGHSALEAIRTGSYEHAGISVDWSDAVAGAVERKVSLPPDAPLPSPQSVPEPKLLVEVTNESTLGAARRLVAEDQRPLALNFANGTHPGGGFLRGARAPTLPIGRSSRPVFPFSAAMTVPA